MCGRFDLHTPRGLIAETWFGLTKPVGEVHARYNTAPGQSITIISLKDDQVRFSFAHWGYKPAWAGEEAPKPINARAETVANSKYFTHAFHHRRCLIPADGWFEWMATDQGKQPYYITDPSNGRRDVLFFAGIYTGDIEPGMSAAILTEPAAPNLRHIHDRQPVVLDPECRWDWLNPEITERDQVRQVAKRLDPSRLNSWRVSPRMNKPDYNDPSIIEPMGN
ncbi:SOS response-associated peptidase [Vreelandella utahensis]|uniref:SOS response-associated peptidase n=1 Tax=Vreelandella halophila TaxID=86177 RepID=UPI000984F581|nr:SOS response-associated peptidase [Halomonas utahensis]